MKLRFSKRDQLIVAGSTLLLVLLFFYAQFFMLTPLKVDLRLKQQALKTEQKLLDVVSQKRAGTAVSNVEDTRVLQKKIPVEPLQDQFILDLEKAENISNSKIITMGFSKDVDAIAVDQSNPENTNTAQDTSQNQIGGTQGDASQPANNQVAPPPLPTGMKKLTVQLSVESPTYEELEKFIETMESLPRIVVVEAINYAGGQEIISLDQEDEPLSYTLTISAFYMPSLADLAADLPKIDAPAPAGKDNPLSQFPATTQTQP